MYSKDREAEMGGGERVAAKVVREKLDWKYKKGLTLGVLVSEFQPSEDWRSRWGETKQGRG